MAHVQLNSEERHYIFRDQQSTKERGGHGEEEEQIHYIIEARLAEKILEEFRGHFHQPLPVKEQMGHNGGSKCDCQPFMDGIAGQLWAGNRQKGGKDRKVEYEIGFS